MDKQLQEAVFNEVMNRYSKFIYLLIRDKFEGEDINDIYQDFSIFLFHQIGKFYSESANLFDTKAWIRTVTNNFCISELRKRNGKKQLKFISEEKSEVIRLHFADESMDSSSLYDLQNATDLHKAMSHLLSFLSKRDALILKMKYFYGKPSSYISKRMNEAHVDVYIGRLKEKIKKKSGIQDIQGFFEKYRTAM
ncbi:MAG: sigma-70 family RNA polymerase sigma factor [Flavobacteriales bacterium]|nr:sigma-70 family RNA polymerase sigma factor [Flavobacteriales bacterium]